MGLDANGAGLKVRLQFTEARYAFAFDEETLRNVMSQVCVSSTLCRIVMGTGAMGPPL